MPRAKRKKLEIAFVKVRLPPGCWRDVRVMSAHLGVTMQDLAGWLLVKGLEPLLASREMFISKASRPDREILEKAGAEIKKYTEEV